MADPIAILTALLRKSALDDHAQVLQAAEGVLKSSKNHSEALHTRVVALLKLDRFEDALRALDDGGDKLAERCRLEKAYALYKLGKAVPESIASAPTARERRGLKHVAAQAAYRAEDFEKAAAIYKELYAERAWLVGEQNDLRINNSATDAQLEWQGHGSRLDAKKTQPEQGDLEAFETTYNAACGCIAREDYSTAAVLLKKARDLCEALEELSAEEKKAEVLPLMVQQAFVLTKMGKTVEADAVRRMIEIADIPEVATRLIAQNNTLATTKDDNPYMTQRLFNALPKLSSTEKLFTAQSSVLVQNRHAISLQCQKGDGVAASTLSQIIKNPSPSTSPHINSLSVLNCAAHTKSEISKTAIKTLLDLKGKRPTDLGLLLTLTQLYVQTSNPLAAIPHLENFRNRLATSDSLQEQSIRHAPGLVALIVSLYRLCNRHTAIRATFREAATYWLQASDPSIQLLYAAGKELLYSTNHQDGKVAREIFTYLLSRDQEDRFAQAGFVSAHSHTDRSTTTELAQKLTTVASLTKHISATELLAQGVPSLPTPAPTQPSNPHAKRPPPSDTPKAKESSEPAFKKLKTRPSKLPKDLDSSKVPDPERWLPLKDRTTYRPKGRKGKGREKAGAEMMQGVVVKEKAGEQIDFVGTAGVKNERKGTTPGVAGAGAGAGAGGKGKKKPKGKR